MTWGFGKRKADREEALREIGLRRLEISLKTTTCKQENAQARKTTGGVSFLPREKIGFFNGRTKRRSKKRVFAPSRHFLRETLVMELGFLPHVGEERESWGGLVGK